MGEEENKIMFVNMKDENDVSKLRRVIEQNLRFIARLNPEGIVEVARNVGITVLTTMSALSKKQALASLSVLELILSGATDRDRFKPEHGYNLVRKGFVSLGTISDKAIELKVATSPGHDARVTISTEPNPRVKVVVHRQGSTIVPVVTVYSPSSPPMRTPSCFFAVGKFLRDQINER